MKSYVILEKKKGKEKLYQAVNEGFSFKFFFFNVLWLIYHRMYVSAFLFFSVFGILNEILDNFVFIHHFLIMLFIYMILSLKINDMRLYGLEQQGFVKKAHIIAFNELDAKLRYLNG